MHLFKLIILMVPIFTACKTTERRAVLQTNTTTTAIKASASNLVSSDLHKVVGNDSCECKLEYKQRGYSDVAFCILRNDDGILKSYEQTGVDCGAQCSAYIKQYCSNPEVAQAQK